LSESYGFNEQIQRKARNYLYSQLRASLCRGIVIFVLALLGLSLRLSTALENFVKAYISEPLLVVALYFNRVWYILACFVSF